MIKLNTKYLKNIKLERDVFTTFKQKKVNKVHKAFRSKQLPGYEMTDWANWPVNYFADEVDQINSKVRELHQKGVQTLLVIGIGGSFLGSKSAIDFVKGSIDTQDDVIFAGIDVSASAIEQIERKLENKKWAIAVISKSGTTLEPAVAFRHFRLLLEKKEGSEAKHLIVAVTDGEKGTLHDIACDQGYTKFIVPNGIGGRFSGITPVGLFPMAFAGIDIKEVLKGAAQAREKLLTDSNIRTNEAYQYAMIRDYFRRNKYSTHIHWRKGVQTPAIKMSKRATKEIYVGYEPDMEMTLEWLKQLYGESEGKNSKAIYPTSALYTRDLHSLGQIIQEGNKDFFETIIWVKNHKERTIVEKTDSNDDGLNYLANKSVNELNEIAMESVAQAHAIDGGIPNLIIEVEDKSERSLGYMWYFFFMSVTLSGYLLKVNPFDQPGVEVYKKRLFKSLDKPE